MRVPLENRTPKAISERLIATRKALNLNQRQLCQRAHIGTSTYNQWEKGYQRPDLDEAIKLVETFDLTLDWIYLGDDRRLPYDLGLAIASQRGADAADP